MSDEPGAIWIGNQNYWQGRGGYQPQYVIIHGTAGGDDARRIADYFKSTVGTDSPVSAHYIIDQSGLIVQTVLETDSAWANGFISKNADPWWRGNPNRETISIEHCKRSRDNSDALTLAQQAASFRLIWHICQRWGIPPRPADATGGITGHYSIDPATRANCPGSYPWADLWQYLANQSGIPVGWKDDGQVLKAPNGVPVILGFRKYILCHKWETDNWPLQPEEARDPLELSNRALGKGTQQIFRWKTLEWTDERGVFEAWTGPEILALRAGIQK